MNITHRIFRRRATKYKVLDSTYEQAEIKLDHEGTQGLIFVGTDGFDIRDYERRGGMTRNAGTKHEYTTGDTCGKNIRLSLNSPLTLTWPEWYALVEYIEAVKREVV